MVSVRPNPSNVIKPWELPPQNKYTFINATVIDPTDGTSKPGLTVVLLAGLIKTVSKTQPFDCVSNDGSIVIDLEGKFLSPGLIDCHIHIATTPGESTLRDTMVSPSDVSLLRQTFVCSQILRRGFTAVRDCGGASLALKEAIAENVIQGPRLFISGQAISQTGGHGDMRSAHQEDTLCCGGHGSGLGKVADGVPACFQAARDELRKGADFIKIMCSGGVASPTDKLKSVQYTPEEIRAFTTVAKNSGTYVTAHAYTPESIKQAVENGVTGIEHGNLIDRETAEFMAKNGVTLTPTLVTYKALGSHEFSDFLPPSSQAKNQEVLRKGLDSIKLAHEAGVTMLFGTDLLGPLTKSQTQEFALRAQVLDAKTILQSATINAAQRLGQSEFLGQIKEGFAADILILTRNPLEDIEVLDQQDTCLLAVIKDGRVYSSRWSKLKEDAHLSTQIIE
jgi:imidazolonepropionase-like amidohydrolase